MNFLKLAAVSTSCVALLHLGCIVFGAPWYRFLGAGEQMALMAEAGSHQPTIVTSVLVFIFVIWTAYALSGAGVIRKLPLLHPVLIAITTILLLRGVGFYFIMPMFPDNSLMFWFISSSICLLLGLLYALGLKQSWQGMPNKKLL